MIQSHPDALEGSVTTLPRYVPSDFPLGSAVLCRNIAPLVAFAYGLLQRDVPCRILGRDIGKQLTDVVRKLRALDLSNLQDKLTAWEQRESERAELDGRNPERIYDQAACIRFFCRGLDEDSQTVADLLAKIDLMFTDDSSGAARVTLSTVHKSKGLEYPTVFLLDRAKLMPSRYAEQPWQKVQERNLLYVAVTRAQERLVYINSDNWKE